MEFEKLRTYPVESQDDRVLPVFENGSAVEEALLRIQEIRLSTICHCSSFTSIRTGVDSRASFTQKFLRTVRLPSVT